MKKTQKGFALIEGLLIILILVIIGFGGYYVWNSQKQTNKTLDTAASTSQKAASSEAANKPGQMYLTIKEWGVRLPYSGDDIYTYKINPDNPKLASVISKNLADKYQCTDSGAGTLVRNSPDDNIGPPFDSGLTVKEDAQQNPGAYKVVGNYYYGFSHDKFACSDSVTSETQDNANDSVMALLPKLEATPQ